MQIILIPIRTWPLAAAADVSASGPTATGADQNRRAEPDRSSYPAALPLPPAPFVPATACPADARIPGSAPLPAPLAAPRPDRARQDVHDRTPRDSPFSMPAGAAPRSVATAPAA